MSNQALHLHPIFRSDLATAPLRQALEQMELIPARLDDKTRALVNGTLDHLLEGFQKGTIDRETVDASLQQIDQFVHEDFTLQRNEVDHLRNMDRRLAGGVFDRQRYLDLLSPLAIPIDPIHQPQIDAALRSFEPQIGRAHV